MVNETKVLEEVAEAAGLEANRLEFSDEFDKKKTVAVHITVPTLSLLTWKNGGGDLGEGNHTFLKADVPGGMGDGSIYAHKADDVDVYYINEK